MKKFLLFFLVNSILFSNITSAQSVKWGQEAKTYKANGKLKSLGWYKGYLYMVETEGISTLNMGGEIRLEKLSKDLNVVLSIELEEAKSNYNEIYIKNDEIVIHNTKYNRSGKEVELYQFRYNLNGKYLSKKKLATLYADKQTTSGEFNSSPDKSRINFLKSNTDYEQNTIDFTSLTFNSSNEFDRFDQKFELEKDIEYLRISQQIVDDYGNLYFVINVKKEYGDDISKNHLVVLDKDGNYLLNKKLDFEGFYLTQIELKLSKDNHMYITGMITSLNEKEKPMNNGFFLADLNKSTFEIEHFENFLYSEEFFLSLGYKIKKDGRVRFGGYYTIDIELNDKDGGYLIARHQKNYTTAIQDYEMVTFSFDEVLKMGSPQVVVRSLISDERYLNGLGYFSFIKDRNLYLAYSDYEKNIDETDLDELKSADSPDDKKTKLFLAKIEGDKPPKRIILSEENEIKGYLIPEKCQASDDKVIINVGNKKKTLYGELKF